MGEADDKAPTQLSPGDRGTGDRGTPERGLDARKATILQTVVQEHIVTGQPVGSGQLAAGLNVSSATIRNEMSVLEREGYLTHPHTSAGRIPTDRGYRYFVDTLGERTRLADAKNMQVRQFFDAARADIEALMSDATRLLTDLTDYAAVLVAPSTETVTIRSIQVIDLGSSGLVVVVLSNGAIEKATLDLGEFSRQGPVAATTLNAVSARLNAMLVGKTLGNLRDVPLIAVRDVAREGVVDLLCNAAIRAIRPTQSAELEHEVFVGGASRMVGAFDTVSTIKRVLATLEEEYVVVNLIREALDRPNPSSTKVSIGAEHGTESAYESLLSCSIVVAPYMVDGRSVGTVGVLGPTRMDYPNAMAAVSAVSDALTERLTDQS